MPSDRIKAEIRQYWEEDRDRVLRVRRKAREADNIDNPIGYFVAMLRLDGGKTGANAENGPIRLRERGNADDWLPTQEPTPAMATPMENYQDPDEFFAEGAKTVKIRTLDPITGEWIPREAVL